MSFTGKSDNAELIGYEHLINICHDALNDTQRKRKKTVKLL